MVAGPLADAGALRRLEHLLRLRAGALPARRATRRPTTAACRAGGPRGSRAACWSRRSCCSRSSRFPSGARNVDAMPPLEQRDDRPRRRRAVRLERPLSRRRTASSAARTSRWSTRTIRSASIATSRSARTTSSPINRMNLPVGKAGRDHALEQGRHPQLRPAADAREAGRDSRHRPAGLVHADADRPSGTSRARSCAGSGTSA